MNYVNCIRELLIYFISFILNDSDMQRIQLKYKSPEGSKKRVGLPEKTDRQRPTEGPTKRWYEVFDKDMKELLKI